VDEVIIVSLLSTELTGRFCNSDGTGVQALILIADLLGLSPGTDRDKQNFVDMAPAILLIAMAHLVRQQNKPSSEWLRAVAVRKHFNDFVVSQDLAEVFRYTRTLKGEY